MSSKRARGARILLLAACALVSACQGQPSAPKAAAVGRAATTQTPLPAAAPPLMSDNVPATPLPAGILQTPPAGVELPTLVPLPAPDAPLAPAPVPSIPPLEASQVLSNTLPAGIGSVGGSVVQRVADQYVGVPGASVKIVSALDGTLQASLQTGSRGTFQVSNVALGNYYVQAEKRDFISDVQPSLLRLYPGYTAAYSLFLLVPATP